MESAYLETTFFSYLVARLSRDLLVAAHQQITQEWWATRRNAFACCVSQVVVDEVSDGDPAEVKKRFAVVSELSSLEVTPAATPLTASIFACGVLPPRAFPDLS